LALTEEEPAIKAYDEKSWAELPDARTAPVNLSLTLLDGLHQRWTLLLRSLSPKDFTRTFRHSELGLMSLNDQLGLYHWHGQHHLAHITSLKQRMH
jgi:DinB superfamily